MMSAPRPMLDLLGARWDMATSVAAAGWDAGGGGVAGFALADGTLALARPQWEGGPGIRTRSGGGVELVSATAPPPPVARIGVHTGACLSLAPDPGGGFVTGGEDGRFCHVGADGAVSELCRFAGVWADPVAAGADGVRACATGKLVHIVGSISATLDLPDTVAALAFDRDGRHLAIAHEGGVTLWRADAAPRLLSHRGAHRALAWSPDGAILVSGLDDNTLHGWRVEDGSDIAMGACAAPPRSLSFSCDGKFLAVSGGSRAVCWPFDPPQHKPSECGMSARAPVTVVACHPARRVLAAGYRHGAVLLCQPGSDDTLLLRAPDEEAVSALAWSSDGAALTIGIHGGEIAVLTLPERLFRADVPVAEPSAAA